MKKLRVNGLEGAFLGSYGMRRRSITRAVKAIEKNIQLSQIGWRIADLKLNAA